MKKKLLIIASSVLVVALIVCAAVFFSHNSSKVEGLFDDTIKALDSDKDLSSLFVSDIAEKSETFKDDIKAINEFYKGSHFEIKNDKSYRETATGYRMYGTVKTDEGTYFITINATGARQIDSFGIKQLIIENYKEFHHKKIFKKEKFDQYIDHAKEYGITIRTKGDK